MKSAPPGHRATTQQDPRRSRMSTTKLTTSTTPNTPRDVTVERTAADTSTAAEYRAAGGGRAAVADHDPEGVLVVEAALGPETALAEGTWPSRTC